MPIREPDAKPITDDWSKSDDVLPFLHKYVTFLEGQCDDPKSLTYKERFPLVKYWNDVIACLSKDLCISSEGMSSIPLKYGFWPRTNHGTGHNTSLDSSTPSN